MEDRVMFYAEIKEHENDELEIKGYKWSVRFQEYRHHTIYIPKESIPWIISTFRKEETGKTMAYDHNAVKQFTECRINFFFEVGDNDFSWVEIYPYWEDKEKRKAPISIPYLSMMGRKGGEMKYIEPFLKQLEAYLTPEERAKLPEPWSAYVAFIKRKV